MKKPLFAVALTAVLAVSLSGQAQAKEDMDYWNNYDPIIPETGVFTNDYPVASRILTLPVRAVSTPVGALVGTVTGIGKGIVHAEMVVSEHTFERIPEESAAIMAPAGLVGSVVAAPVGAVNGAVRGFGQGMISGFMLPEAY